MRRFTIMGFTEAELGFVLAALFVAVAAMAIHERDVNAADIEQSVVQSDSLERQLEAARDSIRERLAAESLLRDSLATLMAKISTKVPQCWEKGESAAPVATLDVLGANQYRLGSERLDIDQVRERLASFIARGDSLGCRFIVRARPAAAVNALQQSDAVWRLRRYFDVNDRPQ